MSSGNASKQVGEFELDPALDIEWEALDGILFDGATLPEQEEEDCIRINPISSNFSLSQKSVKSNSAKSQESVVVAPLSSFATTNISSYLDRGQVYPPSVPSFPTSYPSYAPQDAGEVHYPGSAGNSKKSVEFEEFLKTPAARELFEGSPSYSFSSIGTIEATPVNRKMKRDEAFGMSGYDDEDADGIKAMRGGSLGRVIASSVAAGTIVGLDANARLFSGDGQTVNPSILQQAVGIIPNGTNNVMLANGLSREEERKQLVSQFFQRLNRCDISGLVQIIRHCDEVCVLSTPDVLDPIIGRSDIMMLISLYIEAYPDGVWTPSAISLVGDTASCTYRFMGTRVFDHPINTLYRQIKTHMGTIMAASSQHHQIDFFANAMDAQRLVNEVAESAVPIDSHHTHTTSEASSSQEQASAWQDQQQQQETNQPIMFRRRSRSLREVKAIETVVLEEGPTTYRRKLEFIFNEYNEIVQILYTNIL